MTEIDGIGPHRPDDVRGWLVFEWLPDDIQRAEDSTQYGDCERRNWRASVCAERPASATERLLLSHLGYAVGDELVTRVEWLSNGVRRRTWPQLETTEG